ADAAADSPRPPQESGQQQLRHLQDGRRGLSRDLRARLRNVPAGERDRAAQRKRPVADLFPAAVRGQALLRQQGAARLRLREGPRPNRAARRRWHRKGHVSLFVGQGRGDPGSLRRGRGLARDEGVPGARGSRARAGRRLQHPPRSVAHFPGFRQAAVHEPGRHRRRGGGLLQEAWCAWRLHAPEALRESVGVRILVTGGAGCLGSNLIEHWLPLGHELLALDNFATGKREVLPAIKGLRVVEGSIADSATVDRLFRDFEPDVVVHSAAAYKDPANWREDAQTNVAGAINVARAAEQAAVRRLVNFQTALCYGRPRQVPVPADHPSAPFTSYGISKTAGEQYLLMAKIPVTSFRIANVTGPRLAIGPIPTFFKRLQARQNCFCSDTTRDFLDMSDFLALM